MICTGKPAGVNCQYNLAHELNETVLDKTQMTLNERKTGWAKKTGNIFVRLMTSPNINRFLKFFHYQNQEKICNNIITIDFTTSAVKLGPQIIIDPAKKLCSVIRVQCVTTALVFATGIIDADYRVWTVCVWLTGYTSTRMMNRCCNRCAD